MNYNATKIVIEACGVWVWSVNSQYSVFSSSDVSFTVKKTGPPLLVSKGIIHQVKSIISIHKL